MGCSPDGLRGAPGASGDPLDYASRSTRMEALREFCLANGLSILFSRPQRGSSWRARIFQGASTPSASVLMHGGAEIFLEIRWRIRSAGAVDQPIEQRPAEETRDGDKSRADKTGRIGIAGPSSSVGLVSGSHLSYRRCPGAGFRANDVRPRSRSSARSRFAVLGERLNCRSTSPRRDSTPAPSCTSIHRWR